MVSQQLSQQRQYAVNVDIMFQALFGFFDGAINALPKGSLVSNCGLLLKAQRMDLLNMTNFIINKDILNAVNRYNTALNRTYNLTYNCYYGFSYFLSSKYQADLWLQGGIGKNILFNSGFMYTDVLMMIVGQPGRTLADYIYFQAFYIGDFVFRLIFRQEPDGYCWLNWNMPNCQIEAAKVGRTYTKWA